MTSSFAASPAISAISGTTRVFQILGDPVAQVLAPRLYNHLFARHGADAVLVPAQVDAAEVDAYALQALKARNMGGLWLTIPHKTTLLKFLDHCDAQGRAAGAVNAVRRNADGSLEGALFDGTGFAKALSVFGIPVAGRRILVVGIGGAGKAIAAALAALQPALLALHDATPGRTDAFAASLRAGFDAAVQAVASSDPAGYDLVVNATPLGLRPDDPLPFDVARLAPEAAVVDILMKRRPTPLLQACAERGITAHAGFEMLAQQVPEYLDFFGYGDIARQVQADPAPVRALLAA